MEPSHVLVPLDGSPLADDALEYALAVFDCRLTVLNVITSLDAGMSEGDVLEPGDDRLQAARERANRLIEDAASRTATTDREIETVVDTGDPAAVILEYIDQEAVDHVVMGASSTDSGELTRRLLGTVTTSVIAEASVPVTVIQ